MAPYFVHCVSVTIYCSESHPLLISVLKWFGVDAFAIWLFKSMDIMVLKV